MMEEDGSAPWTPPQPSEDGDVGWSTQTSPEEEQQEQYDGLYNAHFVQRLARELTGERAALA